MNWLIAAISPPRIQLWVDDARPAPLGFEHAKNGTEALDWISKAERGEVIIDFISLDHDLGPGTNGNEVARTIEELAFFNKIPRIRWNSQSQNPVGRANIQKAMQSADRYWNSHENIQQ